MRTANLSVIRVFSTTTTLYASIKSCSRLVAESNLVTKYQARSAHGPCWDAVATTVLSHSKSIHVLALPAGFPRSSKAPSATSNVEAVDLICQWTQPGLAPVDAQEPL
jgi:hypothetical protein